MKKEPKKKVTIEGLAETVNNLAAAMDRGFNDVNKNFKGVREKMNKGFDDVNKKMDKGFDDVHEKMDKGLNDVYKKMDKGFAKAHKEIEDLAIMTGNGFKEVDRKFDEVNEKMDKGFVDVNSRLDNVEIKLRQVDIRLVKVEDNQLDLKLRMDVLSNNNKGIDELRSRVVVLEKKAEVKGV